MNNVEVPRPETIFDDMSESDIVEFGENSAEYITVVDSDCVLVLNLCPEFLIAYEIYCTFDSIPQCVMTDLRDYGYKIIYSDKKLSDKFNKLSDTFRAVRIAMLFDKEYAYYAYL